MSARGCGGWWRASSGHAGEVAHVGVGHGQHTVMVQSRLMSPGSCVSLSSLQNYENSYVVLPQDLQDVEPLRHRGGAHSSTAVEGPSPASFGWLASGWGQGEFVSEAEQYWSVCGELWLVAASSRHHRLRLRLHLR
jgi:hypothetical protein